MSKNNLVIIPNRGSHDFSAALKFGDLRYVTEGTLNAYRLKELDSHVARALDDTLPTDYIMFSGLPILNSLIAARFAAMHGRVNFLLYRNKAYTVRTIRYTK